MEDIDAPTVILNITHGQTKNSSFTTPKNVHVFMFQYYQPLVHVPPKSVFDLVLNQSGDVDIDTVIKSLYDDITTATTFTYIPPQSTIKDAEMLYSDTNDFFRLGEYKRACHQRLLTKPVKNIDSMIYSPRVIRHWISQTKYNYYKQQTREIDNMKIKDRLTLANRNEIIQKHLKDDSVYRILNDTTLSTYLKSVSSTDYQTFVILWSCRPLLVGNNPEYIQNQSNKRFKTNITNTTPIYELYYKHYLVPFGFRVEHFYDVAGFQAFYNNVRLYTVYGTRQNNNMVYSHITTFQPNISEALAYGIRIIFGDATIGGYANKENFAKTIFTYRFNMLGEYHKLFVNNIGCYVENGYYVKNFSLTGHGGGIYLRGV